MTSSIREVLYVSLICFFMGTAIGLGILVSQLRTQLVVAESAAHDCRKQVNYLEYVDEEKKFIVTYIKQHGRKLGPEYAAYLAHLYQDTARAEGISPFLLVAVGRSESAFSRMDVSSAGAIGIMQVMPFWVKKLDFLNSVEDLYRPALNIRAGARILAMEIKAGGSVEAGLRRYHGGPKATHNPKPETVSYVNTVLHRFNTFEGI